MLKAAKNAAFQMLDFDQSKVDKIVEAMAKAALQNSERLAKMAVAETGFGNYPDKVIKNEFASRDVFNYIKTLKTVGIIFD